MMTMQPAAFMRPVFFVASWSHASGGAANFHSESTRIPGRRRACYARRLPATGTAR
ncbi:hypothetical protein BSLA_01f0889 [Burkholderia stabilis]|nr:hypothetical protein BSLA_01f0889 [Burkholderia stabilis]